MKKTRLSTAAELLSVSANRRRPGSSTFLPKEQRSEFTPKEEAFGRQRPRVTESAPDLGVLLATLRRRPRGRLRMTRAPVVRYSFHL